MSSGNDHDIDDDSNETRNPLRDRMKTLEQENAGLRTRVAEAETATRELAFLKAGVDTSNPAAKWFVKGYDGDLTPDVIRAAAIEATLIRDTTSPTPAEQQAWQKSSQLAAGSPSQPDMDWVTKINQAKTSDEVELLLEQARQSALI